MESVGLLPPPNIVTACAVAQANSPIVVASDGLQYSLLGYAIESVNRASTDADFNTGLQLLATAVAVGADVHAPCWVDTNDNEFDPPLEYLCVLHKIRLGCDAVADLARAVAQAGAKLHLGLLVSSHARKHAQELLRPHTSSA